jgi:hypothetical protein
MSEIKTIVEEYFAASNGFSGFKSLFQEIFDPKAYDQVYVLKGGPGTGKSSIMRHIGASLYGACERIDMIYCSSDVKSLDGLIAEHNGKRIAIIDGTAPHMTDPKYPGAVEKIINLGDAWCESTLKSQRSTIIKLTELKQRAFDSAYRYLRITSSIDESAATIIERIFSFDEEETVGFIPDIANDCDYKRSERLLEAFGSGGFYRLKPPEIRNTHYVVGVYGSERVFYKHILDLLNKRGMSYERHPFVLKHEDTSGIIIRCADTAFINLNGTPNDDNSIIDTSRYLDQAELAKEKNRLEFLWREREIMLWNSVSEFKAAANYHFELEKIYTATMNFTKIDKIKDKLLAGVKKTLDIKV